MKDIKILFPWLLIVARKIIVARKRGFADPTSCLFEQLKNYPQATDQFFIDFLRQADFFPPISVQLFFSSSSIYF